ncbi:MAG: purple acid phosphatase family protein, partial [Promethearchaeota archaeon]
IGLVNAQGSDPPQKIRITSESSFNSSVTITWQTNNPSSENDVVYDNVTHGSSTDPLNDYLHSKTGVDFTYDGASGHIHMTAIDSLDPDTTYYFRCGGDVGGWSEERMFKTAPTSETDFVFVVGGDSQRVGNQMTVTSQTMAQFNASFAVHVGDMVDDGNDQSQWDKWFDDVNDNWVGLNGYTIPVIPTLGNHEANSTKYYMQFALPNNEQWYYYDWGNVRMIVLNCEATSSQIQTDQKEWLEDVLNSTDSSMWKMVFFHRNAYYSGGHENATDLQTHWIPVFDHYNVNIVFQGHNHHYHRTKPLRNNEIVPPNSNGTIYITASGWDANLRDVVPQQYTAHGNKTYNFVLMNVSNDSLYLEAKDSSGSTFDFLWLYKNGTIIGDDIEYDIENDNDGSGGGNNDGSDGGNNGETNDEPEDHEPEDDLTDEIISIPLWWFRFWEWLIRFLSHMI